MTRNEFLEEMERMCHLFDRPFKAATLEAWYPSLVRVDRPALAQALDFLVTSFEASHGERYPSLSTILRTIPKSSEKTNDSCPYCATGTIRFERLDEGYQKAYERVAACDCPAGDRQAAVRHHRGRMRRYSSMFSIESASHGFGMMLSKPSVSGVDDDKDETPEFDHDAFEKSGGKRTM